MKAIGFLLSEGIQLLEVARRDWRLCEDGKSISAYVVIRENVRNVLVRLNEIEIELSTLIARAGIGVVRRSGNVTVHISWRPAHDVYRVRVATTQRQAIHLDLEGVSPRPEDIGTPSELDALARKAIMLCKSAEDLEYDDIAWDGDKPAIQRVVS